MASIERPRRYYLHKRIEAVELLEWDMAGFWRWKQERQPGTSLPADFPHRTVLVAAGYVAVQDVDGADETELQRIGLTAQQAKAVLAAIEPLVG